MPSNTDIQEQQEFLKTHRRTLATYLQRQAQTGSANAAPELTHGIREARENIARIKAVLRSWGETVEDLPDDGDLAVPQPNQGPAHSGENPDWRSTTLWERLKRYSMPEVEDIRKVLNTVMPPIQGLHLAPDSPEGFSLHRPDHAFQVAQRMVQLMPADVVNELTTYELALLLLAAYLHDIGLATEQQHIRQHYTYLLTGTEGLLTPEQFDVFQRWLDEQKEEVTPPLADVAQASLLVTDFCRAHHVAWSEQWMDAHLSEAALGTYVHWLTDLKLICRQHNTGYTDADRGFSAITNELLDPKTIGSAGMIVHLRYLAAVLRIADILALDAERTPPILFRHHAVSAPMAPRWLKDYHVARRQEGERIILSAEPADAQMHRAFEEMKEEIEAELLLIRRLAEEKPFATSRFSTKALYHRWAILPHIGWDVRPLNNAYEYIDGAFRPDTEKLLQLLSGTQLYGNELVAVRELLQNAFDAVREQIAHHRLTMPNPHQPDLESIFGKIYPVKLQLEIGGDNRIWLSCTDQGVGMTKEIIAKYLLISGISRRGDIRQLERRCRQAGFELGRTGQFGIGVLSYFMLADLVEIRTRRSPFADGEAEATGWQFTTTGIGAFGELRKMPNLQPGTQVRLRLHPAVIERLTAPLYERFTRFKPDESPRYPDDTLHWMYEPRDYSNWTREPRHFPVFIDVLVEYLQNTLWRLPCDFLFSSPIHGQLLQLPAGWTQSQTAWTDYAVRHMTSALGVTFNENQGFSAQKLKRFEDLRAAFAASLRWDVFEGDLPGGLGRYRIHMPVFQLACGRSHFFADVVEEQGSILLQEISTISDGTFVYKPAGRMWLSWKGMKVQLDSEMIKNIADMSPYMSEDAIIEIDWQSLDAGFLTVSREHLLPTDACYEAIRALRLSLDTIFQNFVVDNTSSSLARLSSLLIRKESSTPQRDIWVYMKEFQSKKVTWSEIPFPAVESTFFHNLLPEEFGECTQFEWQGRTVSQLPLINLYYRADAPNALHWSLCGYRATKKPYKRDQFSMCFPPDRLVQYRLQQSHKLVFVPIWTQPPRTADTLFLGGIKCQFPDEWSDILGVSISHLESTRSSGSIMIWNRAHPLCIVSDHEIQEWAEQTFFSSINPRPYHDILLSSREHARAWLVQVLQYDSTEFWEALFEWNPQFPSSIWRLVFGHDTEQQTRRRCIFIYDNNQSYEYTDLAAGGMKVRGSLFTLDRLLPPVGPEWTINLIPGSAQK